MSGGKRDLIGAEELQLPLVDSCFFFFQAEDGIRDYKVTGVQTCALPICRVPLMGRVSTRRPSSTHRKRSGDELTTTTSPKARYAANGAGLRCRRRRYSSSGVPASGASSRCDKFAWKMSPAYTYSMTRATASKYPARVKFERKPGTSGTG